MPNPFYQQMMGGGIPQPQFAPPNPRVAQMMNMLQAMRNPAAFVKQQFPDIPTHIMNDPNQIFNYLQQTRNPVNQQQINQAQQMQEQMIQGDGTVR